MATVITHALAASALSALAPDKVSRAKMAISLAIVSALPDIDVVGFAYGVSYGDVMGHRGFTHSLSFALISSLLCAVMVFRSAGLFSRAWWQVFALLFVAAASHGIIDAFTDAGLGIGFFIPFDDTRYFFPWRPLETPPIGVAAFLNGPAVRILINEFIWVGMPVLLALGLHRSIRAVGRRRGA
jgi:inner membrane protein